MNYTKRSNEDTQSKRGRLGIGWWTAAAVLTVLLLSELATTTNGLKKMKLAYTWGPVSFVFDSDSQRQKLERNKTYIPGNAVPFDVDVDVRSDRVFLALPWVLPGAAVTLATVEDRQKSYSPLLRPYPDWSWHAGARGCEGLISVFRVHVDGCGRLWVIDSGIAEITTSFTRKCPAKLLVFDLKTNQLLLKHEIPVEPSCDESLLLSVTVEEMDNTCSDNAYAYVADAGAYNIYVFSMRQKRSWRISNYLFYPDVNARIFRVAGTTLELMDAVLGLAVSPPVSAQCGRYLYFHALSSFQEGRVCTSLLHNASLFIEDENAMPDAFQFIGKRSSQAADQDISSTGVLFFSPVGDYSINCWNYRRNYNSHNTPVVERDPELIRFVTGLKVIASADGRAPEEVWSISNNAQLLFTGRFRPNVNNTVNILRGNARELIRGVNC